VPNLGDMTKFKEWNLESNVDVFVGGTPCQSFSVAGLRKGLDDPRGNLMLTYLAIANQYRPKWLVWENVPGVLSSNGGRDFATFHGGLGELGYGFAYRVLDAQYFGVAQRRRRVFVVGYLGDWRRAAAVLFERHSLSGHTAPSREKGKGSSKYAGKGIAEYSPTIGCEIAKGTNNQMVGDAEAFYIPEIKTFSLQGAGKTSQNSQGSCWNEEVSFTLNQIDIHGVVQPSTFFHSSIAGYREGDIGGTLRANGGYLGGGSETFLAHPLSYDMKQHHNPQPTDTIQITTKNCSMVRGDTPLVQGTDLYNGAITGDVAATMSTHGGDGNGTGPTVMQPIGFEANMSLQQPSTGGVFQTLTRRTHASVNVNMAVRRLTPVECERLQGFPDNYTDIKPKGKATPDGPRYKALGNSMAVPVMAWIGKRIQEVENIK
jgi:DNA (cytosine-5)-methyltransferase 1